MKPIKIKILKRTWPGKETVYDIPANKKMKKKEKENKELEEDKEFQKDSKKKNKKSKILKDSPVPSVKTNSKVQSERDEDFSDDSFSDELHEMFLQLKKNGLKTVSLSCRKESSKSASEKLERKSFSEKKSSECENSESITTSNRKVKKKLINEFENLKTPKKTDKKVGDTEKKIPELEKLPEDLILNYKRTPVKSLKLQIDETPKKEKSVETPLRRSTRRSTLSKIESINIEETPVKSAKKTPSKRSSSVKKKEILETRTPTRKIEERLPTTPLEKARLSLHVSTVPDSLPCREKEYQNILTFLENKLWDGIGGCMYISGVPGTGKTATVTQVVKHLQNLSQQGKVPEFKYIEINGMRLADPRQAYVQLWQKLFERKEKIAPDRALRALDDWFSKSDRKGTKNTTVLLVDELDLICTKKQDVVYNLLDWPTRTHSRLVVLTIANTMDMPERLFKGRVTSRMGLTRLTFMPYTHKQLEEIVLTRLNGLNAFVNDAVRLVTRKVAAVSGDARRALDICRRATELPPPDESVKITHIEQAIREMTNSNIVKIIRNCCEIEKLFLRSLSDVAVRSNVEEVDLREVIDQLLAVCVLEGISRPSISSILSVSNRLKCRRLIFTNQSNAGILQRLTLNVTSDDIHYALKT